ncbi:MAG: 3-oxoacyl-ACP reductase FabG [Gammaproteobacteria bacterium]|jgi:3-oxoacyl-[acyl-carrier protein] reductase|nr:3-oxoacyl-ACP reductase FabG [Gammaproteobacteria bacterium]
MSDGKLALVTGASRGIGKAIALDLAKQGYTVIGTATTDIGATKISTYLESAGFNGKGLRANVACDESVEALYESIIASHGPPGVLVNNAGITRDNLLMRMKPEEWAEVIQTNLSSIFRVSRACIKAMTKARWGRIINISSVVGSSGNGGQTNYSASKAGIEGFTRSLAKEIGSRGITVNAVAPGFIETDMTRELPKQQTEALLAQIPLARLGQPEEIASVVGFLASDKGAYITGETLHVNGGMYMA